MANSSSARSTSSPSKSGRASGNAAKLTAASQLCQLIASGGVPNTHPVLPKTSYAVNTLYRIETMSKAIAQTRTLVDRTKEQLEQRLQHLHQGQSNVKQFQTLRMKVNLLREQLERERHVLDELRIKRANGNSFGKEETVVDVWPDVNLDRCERMAHCFERMKRKGQLLRSHQQQVEQKRRDLARLQDFIYFRRKQLCCELFLMFTISGTPPDRQTIMDIPLPSSEQLLSVDDQQAEAALGFVCQVLIVIAKLIDVPLRFDLLFHGSQNWIVDKTHSELESYPLFHRNGKRDRSRFNYALFLLNRNIAQLRQHFQLPTTDLRLTLNNLLGLFRERLMYKKEDLEKIKTTLSSTELTPPTPPIRPETPLLIHTEPNDLVVEVGLDSDLQEQQKESDDK
jgi:hypothetical protein